MHIFPRSAGALTGATPATFGQAPARDIFRSLARAAYEATMAAVAAGASLVEVAAAPAPGKRRRGAAAVAETAAAAEDADATEEVLGEEGAGEEEAIVKKKKRYYPKKRPVVKMEGAAEDGADGGGAEEDGEEKKKPRRKKYDGPVFEIPGLEVLERARQCGIAARPVPNLGYACLNMELREQRPPIYTNRDCIKKTFDEKGLPWISALALENSHALAAIVQWNWEHDIHFFRLSSTIFPWCTEYEVPDLPDYAAICDALKFAGNLARAYGQRLTFHPSHFVKLATADEALLCKSLKELEVHSQVMDTMGYEPSPWNKINIHVGGVYGDKVTSLARFAAGFRRLSPACQKRLTVENDDVANSYSLEDLLVLHKDIRCPLVFDFHHHKFCPGSFTEEQALRAAIATWPPGVRPVVHWSESQEGRKAHAHSDFIQGPMNLHGLEADIDVMIEAKCKERALLRFREGVAAGPSADALMAGKLLDD
ncbi:hypothetical protein WJX81_005743 [Elliptochloris bilobata]|uniref:UV-endonuclease UvdE n=1 Tax=Elliptochloris bilobata TaxID=381761 RepID=A0AAW1SEN8_9CHLO